MSTSRYSTSTQAQFPRNFPPTFDFQTALPTHGPFPHHFPNQPPTNRLPPSLPRNPTKNPCRSLNLQSPQRVRLDPRRPERNRIRRPRGPQTRLPGTDAVPTTLRQSPGLLPRPSRPSANHEPPFTVLLCRGHPEEPTSSPENTSRQPEDSPLRVNTGHTRSQRDTESDQVVPRDRQPATSTSGGPAARQVHQEASGPALWDADTITLTRFLEDAGGSWSPRSAAQKNYGIRHEEKMTFAGDAEAYKRMLSESFGRKACEAEESCGEYLVLPKCEHIEETLVVGEEIVVDENLEMSQQEEAEGSKEARLFFQDEGDSDRVAVEFVECGGQMSMDEEEKRWEETEDVKQLPMGKEESETEVGCAEVASDDQDADEETIATFVTAAGQQLALYAVEDSEEIFAVAVYDESGEPPTNFQFLMKADVERLIGEGAVRTVKKPTQIKKQLLTTQPPLFFSKTESMHHVAMEEQQQKIVSDEAIVSNQRIRRKDSWQDDSDILQEDLSALDDKPVPNIIYATGGKQSDVAYLMMDNCSVNIDDPEDVQDDAESDVELVEQSTVQYILFEGDQSDSELTFDEIQATLQNLKRPKHLRKPSRRPRDPSAPPKPSDVDYHRRSAPNHCKTLAERRLNFLESRRELLDTLGDSALDTSEVPCKLDLSGESTERPVSPECVAQARFRAKRPRKQQLTSVNREDSEIIIQPASLISEEDTASRKRGKRKRRVVAGHAGYARSSSESKRPRRTRRKEVEVIELDAEEEEKRDVVEITIDDSKDKYSSDKENEIIMVGDSDEESQQADQKAPGVLQCRHCARNFRQQRALETHLRVCSKSPSNAVRFVERERQEQKKQYACKVCQAKFDVVVALARHVRAEHSQRKRRRFSKSSMEREPEGPPPPEERKERKMSGLGRARRKRGQKRPGCAWEVKKLSCTDCGRWFPSAALLRAHCLQHGTKKSEQQIRRCQICKKLIKSRLLFVRHLKKHGSVGGGGGGGGGGQQATTKSVSNMQKKLHTTRSVTRKITLRKRGRPRKL